MSDFINSVITIILLALGFIVGPIMSLQTTETSLARQQIVNDTNQFLNGLSDRAYITGDELDDYLNQINSHGLKMDASIKVSVKAPSTDVNGNAITLMIPKYSDFDLLDSTEKRLFNKGDIIEVELNEIGVSYWRHLLYRITRLDPGGFRYHMADSVQ